MEQLKQPVIHELSINVKIRRHREAENQSLIQEAVRLCEMEQIPKGMLDDGNSIVTWSYNDNVEDSEEEHLAKIEKLKGALDCAQGNPAKQGSADYMQGYSEQYAVSEQKTSEIIEAF